MSTLGRAALGLVAGALLLTGCSAGSSAASVEPAAPGAGPVLFVHGYGEDPAVFDAMREHLVARGWSADSLLAVELDPTGSNPTAAAGPITDGVARLLAAGGGSGKIDLVAHSMGAVSARWYATQLHPELVRSLTTVVGANHGTDVLCGLDGEGAAEMCPAFADDATQPNQVVQTGLNGTPDSPVDETPYGRGEDPAGVQPVPADASRAIRYATVAIPLDEWIKPVASSALAGADPVPALPPGVPAGETGQGNLVFTGPTDHDAILSDDAMLLVLDVLLDAAGTS